LRGVKFRRQVPIGQFIVDFCSFQPRLIIEVDGGQHLEQRRSDNERTAFLERSGYRVMRFWNHDVALHLDVVLAVIDEAIASFPHPDPLPEGEGNAAEVVRQGPKVEPRRRDGGD
jgi:very-short-patch-repair endonuclease